MGAGDLVCISMTGGAPWGFRLRGGREQSRPLQVAKIRSQSKASGSGLCEGDEVVSINGSPCADLTYPEVIQLMESITDSLQMLIKRPSIGAGEALVSVVDNQHLEHVTSEGSVERTTLQIRAPSETLHQEFFIAPAKDGLPLAEDQGSCSEGSGSAGAAGRRPESPGEHLSGERTFRGAEAGAEAPRPSALVELHLSLPPGRREGTSGAVVTLLGSESLRPRDPGSSLQQEGAICGKAHAADRPADAPARSPAASCAELGGQVVPARAGADAPAPGAGAGPQAPPPAASVSAACPQAEGLRGDPGRGRPHRHRARHARLRRSESLSEKQVKEAKSKCKSIARLLTAPDPSSRGVLMFQKRRRRARRYTLVSYGTGELELELDGEDPGEAALLDLSDSEAEEELLSDAEDHALALSFDWDSGLVDIERRPSGEKMEMLPDTAGKGALMFARRRERMDQISAQKEEERPGAVAGGEPEASQTDGLRSTASYPSKEGEAARAQGFVGKSYVQPGLGPGPGPGPSPGPVPQQNGLGLAGPAGSQRVAPLNRTAKPFPGPAAQPAAAQPAAPFSPTRSLASPLSDFPAPPPYSAVTPPPEGFSRGLSSPVAGPAPPPWPQPAFYDASEQIASRDERIAVPAKRTGILLEAKRRSTTKPMFTFKEPKVSPNPELLSLLQNSEGKRGTGAGADSGPEEDYLSLGAEACNFMQGSSAKQKTPPPVAPKPAARSPSQPVTPVSPVWAPGAASTQPPAFPASNPSQGTVVSSIKVAQPSYAPARPASALTLAGPFRGPQAAVASLNYTPKPAAPASNAAHTGAAGPASQLPGMSGKGAQLFAKRQSRMEKYVVDSETVQTHAARAQSPTPSLPASWKYSSNVRAPPPVAYNPIHSPSYPLAALKSQPSAPQAPRAGRKKGKKPLNTLDVMKHQPYQLNASLFTFQPPDAKSGLPQKPATKVSSAPASRQALPPPPANVGSPTSVQAASVYSVPAYPSPPTFFTEATSPVSASPVPVAVPTSPKPEPATASYFVAPRPKFSAKKSGVTAQASGRSLSLPGRSVPAVISAASPWVYQLAYSYSSKPTDGLERPSKKPTPWEAAAKSPLGLVDDAFRPRNIQEAIVANVVSAARRKVLPGSPEDWDERLFSGPQTQMVGIGSLERQESYNVASPAGHSMSPSALHGPQWPYVYYRQASQNDSKITSLETRSDYSLPVTGCNYNPRPRQWRAQM